MKPIASASRDLDEIMGRIRASNGELNRILGARIRALRLEKGYTQTKIATELNISFQQFQKYEKGANRMTIDTLQTIADVLGVPARQLLDPFEGVEAQADQRNLLTADNIKILHDLAAISDPRIKSRVLGLVEAVAQAQSPDGADAVSSRLWDIDADAA